MIGSITLARTVPEIWKPHGDWLKWWKGILFEYGEERCVTRQRTAARETKLQLIATEKNKQLNFLPCLSFIRVH